LRTEARILPYKARLEEKYLFMKEATYLQVVELVRENVDL